MELRRKGIGALARCAEALDLPSDLVAGLPKIELTAAREVYISRHRGILAYSETEIDVNTAELMVRIMGTGLQLLAMTEEELRIGGKVEKVELLE